MISELDWGPAGQDQPLTLGQQEPSMWHMGAGDRSRYLELFEKGAGVLGGGMPMGAAVQVFRMSDLPDGTLAKVWDLATFEQTSPGALTFAEFCAGMHLLTVSRQQRVAIPDSLPTELRQGAARLPSAPQ